MYGKSFKLLNTLKKKHELFNTTSYSYKIIFSEKEYSFIIVNLKKKGYYCINEKNFFLLKKLSNNIQFTKKFYYIKNFNKKKIFLFFQKKIDNVSIRLINKKLFANNKILNIKKKIKKKYWGSITTFLSNKLGAIKMINMKKNTQSSMEFHIKKKESYFILDGLLNIGIRYAKAKQKKIKLIKNNSFLMNIGTMHMRMAKENTAILEMSTQDHDSDSIIIHDGKNYNFKSIK